MRRNFVEIFIHRFCISGPLGWLYCLSLRPTFVPCFLYFSCPFLLRTPLLIYCFLCLCVRSIKVRLLEIQVRILLEWRMAAVANQASLSGGLEVLGDWQVVCLVPLSKYWNLHSTSFTLHFHHVCVLEQPMKDGKLVVKEMDGCDQIARWRGLEGNN